MKAYQKTLTSLFFAGLATSCLASENSKTNLEKKLEAPQSIIQVNKSQIFHKNNKITYANGHAAIYDKQGRLNYFNGHPVAYDEKGKIRYFNGHPIIQKDNKIVYFNGYPVIYDEKGKVTHFHGLPASYIKNITKSDFKIDYNLTKQNSLMILSLLPTKEQIDNKNKEQKQTSIIIRENSILPKLLFIKLAYECFD